MPLHRWDCLPKDVLDSIRDMLEIGQPQGTSVLKGVHLVNRHWHHWATSATMVLRPSVPRVHYDSNLMHNLLEASASAFPNVQELILRQHLRVRDIHLTLLEGRPKLVSLDLSGCELISEAGCAMLGSLSRLTKLNMDNILQMDTSLTSARWLQHLTGLKGLTDLSLRGWHICVGGARCLATFTSLVSLDLWGSGHLYITDAGAKLLTTLSSLAYLKASGSVTDVGLRHLAVLTSLRVLTLSTDNVTDEGMRYVATLPLLAHLQVTRGSRVTDVGIGELADKLPSLTGLEVPCCHATETSVQLYMAFTALTSLDVSNSTIAKCLHNLATLTLLCRLTLGSVTDSMLKSLGCFPLLSDLFLWNMCKVTNEGMRSLSLLSSLRSLECPCFCPLATEAGLMSLSALSSLTKLELTIQTDCQSRCIIRIADVSARSIAMLTSLQRLVLRATGITDYGMRDLATLTSLTYLDLRSSCLITDVGVSCLTSLVSLKYLNLYASRSIAYAVVDSLSILSSLTTLRTGSYVT